MQRRQMLRAFKQPRVLGGVTRRSTTHHATLAGMLTRIHIQHRTRPFPSTVWAGMPQPWGATWVDLPMSPPGLGRLVRHTFSGMTFNVTADAYDRFMGPFSEPLAARFVE